MTTHGKYCDFDFYVMSLDTSQHYTTHEPTTDHITLDEAVAEYKRRDPLSPDKILIVLGVNFRITAPEYMESAVNLGSFDLPTMLSTLSGSLPMSFPENPAITDLPKRKASCFTNILSQQTKPRSTKNPPKSPLKSFITTKWKTTEMSPMTSCRCNGERYEK